MKYYKNMGILLICVLFLAVSVQASDKIISLDSTRHPIKPGVLVLSSAILPGTGQLLNRKYLKAGTFLALEAGMVSTALWWDRNARAQVLEYHKAYTQALQDTGAGHAKKMEIVHVSKFQTMESEYKRYNLLTWSGGIYLYNLFDAFQLTGLFQDNGKRNPRLAMGLAAIPGLGLGQMYNGSFSKAGMFMMTQVSLGVLAYNNHRLMRIAESNYRRVSDTTITPQSVKSSFSSDWDGKRNNAMKQRNSFIWYSILTYVIGIVDSYVDAHLHDYNAKMKIEPDLVPSESGPGLNLQLSF
jgi:hypothetical protein